MKKKNNVPKKGDKIYVDSSFYISHGRDDFSGGIATVKRVYKFMSGGDPNCIFVDIEEGNKSFNWTQFLSEEQAKLKKQFGKAKAHPSSDIDTPWLEEGDSYSHYDTRTGKTESGIYHGPPEW